MVPLFIRNIVLDLAGININYAMKKITFKVLPNIYLPFLVSRDNTAISRRVALLKNVILLPGRTRLVKAYWKPLPSGRMFMLNITHYTVINALVDLNTPRCVKIMNLNNRFLKVRKQELCCRDYQFVFFWNVPRIFRVGNDRPYNVRNDHAKPAYRAKLAGLIYRTKPAGLTCRVKPAGLIYHI